MLRPARQIFPQTHRHRIRKEVGQTKDQNRQPADLRHPFDLCACEPGHNGKGRDNPVIAAIDDLFQELLHPA